MARSTRDRHPLAFSPSSRRQTSHLGLSLPAESGRRPFSFSQTRNILRVGPKIPRKKEKFHSPTCWCARGGSSGGVCAGTLGRGFWCVLLVSFCWSNLSIYGVVEGFYEVGYLFVLFWLGFCFVLGFFEVVCKRGNDKTIWQLYLYSRPQLISSEQ